MTRALDDGIFRSFHTWGIGERGTRASTSSTWFAMLAQVESPVNSVEIDSRNTQIGTDLDTLLKGAKNAKKR
jgi:hypothetical protein